MEHRRVLISGAGIAGSTLAYWLSRHGFVPTVVERGNELRSGGSPVDVRGSAVGIVKRMGIMAQLRESATHATHLTFVDSHGHRTGGLSLSSLPASDREDVELPRADLATVLYRAGSDDVEYLFNDSISALDQDEHGVAVTFKHAAPQRFDLVVGADGLHSTVRQLVFGTDQHVRHLGMYVATLPLNEAAENEHEVVAHNTPGQVVALHPARDNAGILFLFRSPENPEFDHRDSQQHKQWLTDVFGDHSWHVPEFLRRARDSSHLYFDAVSRISVPRWSNGRVVLLGDAASCVSLFGDGSTFAIAGASTLANALALHPHDHRTAFTRYESEHRRVAGPKQRATTMASRFLVPATRLGIRTRDTATRLWSAATDRQSAGTTSHRRTKK